MYELDTWVLDTPTYLRLYEEGGEACRRGETGDGKTCPYPYQSPEREAWEMGFQNARKNASRQLDVYLWGEWGDARRA